MRIENQNSIGRIGSVRSKTVSNVERLGPGADTVELSGRADDIRVAMEALGEVPPVREDLVADLRRQLQEGTLEISGEALARKLFGKP
jgi:negative regulator of flagellin synthesis FlgM